MANANSTLVTPSGAVEIKDTNLGGTADANVNAGSATLYMCKIDNTANATQKVYVKLWNAVAPTVGTTVPDMVIPAPGGSAPELEIPRGLAFGTGLSMACVTTAGTGGTTSPTAAVVVTVVVTA